MSPGHSDARMTAMSLAIGLLSAGVIDAREQFVLQRRIDERVGDRFLVAARGQDLQRLRFDRRLLRRAARTFWRTDGIGFGDGFEADDARQFFDEVGLDVDVEAMRRRRHQPAVVVGAARAFPATSSVALTSLSAIVRAEQPRDALAAQRDFQAPGQRVFESCTTCTGPALPPAISSSSCVARSTARSW